MAKGNCTVVSAFSVCRIVPPTLRGTTFVDTPVGVVPLIDGKELGRCPCSWVQVGALFPVPLAAPVLQLAAGAVSRNLPRPSTFYERAYFTLIARERDGLGIANAEVVSQTASVPDGGGWGRLFDATEGPVAISRLVPTLAEVAKHPPSEAAH